MTYTPHVAVCPVLPDKSSTPTPLLRFWQTVKGYWSRQGDHAAWPVTLSLLGVVLLSLAVTYSINLWNRHFFDALEAKNAPAAIDQALLFPGLVGVYLMVCVFGMWARMTAQRTWRAWCNDHLLCRWLARNRFYKLELIGGDHRNPEHRLNDDLRVATEMPVDFATGFLTALLSAATFIVVLWEIGGSLVVDVADRTIVIPGFLVVAAVIYGLVANGSMVAIAFRFISITENKNQAEAEYRYALTRVRENAESVALLGGEKAERERLRGAFGVVVTRWRELMLQHMRAVIVSQASAQLCGVIPILLCTSRYLEGTMTLGQMMQVASAFTIVQGAFSWFMDNYTRLGDWTASARRVASLMSALDAVERGESEGLRKIQRHGFGGLQLRDVCVSLPDGRRIVQATNATIQRGERVLITGDSGTGKSSLLRALGECWPWAGGQIVCDRGERLFVVPQRPYIPLGTLREVVIYPLESNDTLHAQIDRALSLVGLAHLIPRLNERTAWEHILSAGEKQRVAIARLLLHRPSIIVLDEATSALHVAGEAELMTLIARALPEATIISVGHRPELHAFHDRRITMARYPNGTKIVEDTLIQAAKTRIAPILPLHNITLASEIELEHASAP